MEGQKRKKSEMIQFKSKKETYRNTNKKQKAAFRGRGFQINSKIINKSMKFLNQNMRQKENNRTVFFRKSEK